MSDRADSELKCRVLAQALPHVPFDGWSPMLLAAAVTAAGLSDLDRRRLFPAGAADLVDFHLDEIDRAMLAALARRDLEPLKVRERIALAVRLRLETAAPPRETVRRTLAYQCLPGRGRRALKALYRTVDRIWRAAGDRATDFNFYTKRALLAGVYSATLLYWLNDNSDGAKETWAFLDRRLADVMRIERLRGGAGRLARRLPSPWAALGRLRYSRRPAA
jgi:ubiquinone biosynthesis protein COQ9